jgi:ribonuclease BN (tRNA processing enzyme)
MLNHLIILGGGGWFPAHGRQTACALLRDGDSAVMIDAGTGIGRLVERPDLLEGVVRLDIILTHFHLDHVAGLAYLPGIGACEQTTLWGPGEVLYDTPTKLVLSQLSHEPFHPVPLEAQDIEVRDLPKHELELPETRVQLRRQDRHSAPTLGLRFDDRLTWITDTAYDEASAAFAAGSQMLAHEAWFTESDPRNPDIHSSASQAARIGADAGIDRLLLIHLPPFGTPLDQLLLEAQAHVPRAVLADDGADVSELLLG